MRPIHESVRPLVFALLSAALAAGAPPAAPAAMVDSGLSYLDAADDDLVRNVPRGSIGGGWHRASPGATAVLSPTGYSTPMWQLAAFSGGNDYGDRGVKDGVSRVGGADIPIDDQTLGAWRATLANVRANGALVTPRFAYDYDGVSGCEPQFDTVLSHIRQIAGVLNEYADVVVSVECGIIGHFGEMHSSKYANIEYTPRVVRAWLDALDPRIKLQVRAPTHLFQLFRTEVLGSTANIDGETLLARLHELDGWERIGLYNDGYLGTCADYGTFTDGITSFATGNGVNNFTRAQGMRWLGGRRDIPYGGEIATLTTDEQENTWPPFVHDDYNQVKEWYDSHLSYLRGTPSTMRIVRKMGEYAFSESRYAFAGAPSLSEWNGRTLLDFMRAHMGYRLVLRSSRLSDAAAPGGTLQLAFDVENTGFGDLFLPTRTEVLLQAADDRFWACPVALDLGAAVPSPTRASLSLSLRLPSGITNGQWRVYLRTHVVAAGDSPCAAGLRTVRFANAAAQWSDTLGANLLGTVAVSGAAAEPGLGFRETGAAEPGATAPQVVLAALPAGAAPTVPLSEWSGRSLCLFAPGATDVRYFRAGAELPSTNGAAALPAGDGALGLYAVRYVLGGTSLSRDLFVVVPDGWAGRSWRLETRAGRLRAVCDDTGEETDPAPGHDRELPGRAMEGEPAANAKLVFASSGNEFVAQTPSAVLYPAFTVSGLPAGGGTLGGLRSVTVSSGGGTAIDSNNSGNLNAQAVPLAADGAYLTDIHFTLVNWISPYTFGTVRSLALNDPSATRGGASANLGGARLATLGLFSADPGYHVWFCDEDWTVLCEKSGSLARGFNGNLHAIPIPAATNLYDAAAPADRSDDARCRPFLGWRNLDGSAPGWALGAVALVADYGDAPHDWRQATDPADGSALLRCAVCGRELRAFRPVFADGTGGAPALSFSEDPATGARRLAVRIANAVPGVWYTVFAAEALGGGFRADAPSVRASSSGELVFVLDASPATRFLVVGAGAEPFAAGDALPR